MYWLDGVLSTTMLVSSVKASKQADRDGLFAYLQPAYKAAMARLAAPTKKK